MNANTPPRNILKLELAAEVLRKFAEVHFVARGSSMLPVIYPGDCLTVKAYSDGAPRCGDIVLCRVADGFRVHRIVRILGEGLGLLYVLRGDALTDEDAPVRGGELLGRVSSVARRGKSLEFSATMGIRQRALCAIIRHSRIAVALLLRWQAMQERYSHRAERAGAGTAKAECT